MWRKFIIGLVVVCGIGMVMRIIWSFNKSPTKKDLSNNEVLLKQPIWVAPDTNSIPLTEEGKLIRYGRDLLANTAIYLGPKGKVSHTTNGMNCQNCHLDAGTKFFGNNFATTASTYPKFRARSGRLESIEWRVNDCLERSLNGKALDSSSKEMRAFVAYLKWVGKGIVKGNTPVGAGVKNLSYLNRAADTLKGKTIFLNKCQSCHGKAGEGLLNASASTYKYPPLWGVNSYNIGAGLYRLSRFAGYVRYNMPFGATYSNPILTDEEAWDVAAYVNSQPRPNYKNINKDWPKQYTKPVDYPFGPYVDGFSEQQHKYGPFKPIKLVFNKFNKKDI